MFELGIRRKGLVKLLTDIGTVIQESYVMTSLIVFVLQTHGTENQMN